MRRKAITVIAVLFCALIALCGCGGQTERENKPLHTMSFFALNIYVSLSASGDKEEEALQEARELIERYEDKFARDVNADIKTAREYNRLLYIAYWYQL